MDTCPDAAHGAAAKVVEVRKDNGRVYTCRQLKAAVAVPLVDKLVQAVHAGDEAEIWACIADFHGTAVLHHVQKVYIPAGKMGKAKGIRLSRMWKAYDDARDEKVNLAILRHKNSHS